MAAQQTPKANNTNVPGSGTGAIAVAALAPGGGTTGAGISDSSVGSPTDKLVPSAIAELFVAINVPPLTVVPPSYVFTPDSVNVPAPSLVRLLPGPCKAVANVTF